jgi:uncharacterized protein
MKRLILITLILCVVSVAAKPVLNYWVVDEANILSSGTEASLVNLFENLEKTTTAEMAVVTVNSLDGQDIETYSIELAHGKLGKEGKDNGLLILIAVEDKKYRIEVGAGLEGVLNDAKVGRIARNNFVENFQQGNYDQGVLLASQDIAAIIAGDEDVSEKYSQNISIPLETKIYLVMFGLIFIFSLIASIRRYKAKASTNDIFLAWILADMFSRRGRGGLGGGFGGFGGGGMLGGGASGGWR